MSAAREKLSRYLSKKQFVQPFGTEQLTPDASTREYFRIPWRSATAVACVYPEPFDPDRQSYLDVTRLFLAEDLPVAEVLDIDGQIGVIILEDLGDSILRNVLKNAERETADRLIKESISLIARIQAATPFAFRTGSIASRLKFDAEKLLWELRFFTEHYFESLKNKPLPASLKRDLEKEFSELSVELEGSALVLCHRDFHAANLMVGKSGRLRIIDHQDARIGSVCYDLVSLLLDRVQNIPERDWLRDKKSFFLESRLKEDLQPLDVEKFNYEFELVAVQRCLKAIGTFANQTASLHKTVYADFIPPMFKIVLGACRSLDRFPILQQIIEAEL